MGRHRQNASQNKAVKNERGAKAGRRTGRKTEEWKQKDDCVEEDANEKEEKEEESFKSDFHSTEENYTEADGSSNFKKSDGDIEDDNNGARGKGKGEDDGEDDEEDEDEDEDEEEEEEIDELKCFGIALELPKRANRGKNMKKLIGEDLEKDELFWNNDIWVEEEHDSEYVNSEGEEEYKDITDSDFDVSEDESEDEEDNFFDYDAAKEKEKKRQAMNSYLEKLKRQKKKDDEIRFRHLKQRKLNVRNAGNKRKRQSNEQEGSDTKNGTDETTPRSRTTKGRGRRRLVVDENSLIANRSKRDTTKQKTEEIKQLSELRRIKREKRHQKYCENKLKKLSTKKVMTREERLAEAKITEQYNMESLLQLQAWEEEKKRYVEYKKMMQYNIVDAFVSFQSTANDELPKINVNKYYPYVYWEENPVTDNIPNVKGTQELSKKSPNVQETIINPSANPSGVTETVENLTNIKIEEKSVMETNGKTCKEETEQMCDVNGTVPNPEDVGKRNSKESETGNGAGIGTGIETSIGMGIEIGIEIGIGTKVETVTGNECAMEETTNVVKGGEENKHLENTNELCEENADKKEADGSTNIPIDDLEATEKQMWVFRDEEELYMYSNYNDDKERLEMITNKKRICPITNLEGRYFDPLTRTYYFDRTSFKILRYLYFKKRWEKQNKETLDNSLINAEKQNNGQLPGGVKEELNEAVAISK